ALSLAATIAQSRRADRGRGSTSAWREKKGMRTEVSYFSVDLATDDRPCVEHGADCVAVHGAITRLQRLAYFRTGEFVAAGEYTCTYCGHSINLSRARPLPLCGSCDTDEFMARRPITPTRPRLRPLFAA